MWLLCPSTDFGSCRWTFTLCTEDAPNQSSVIEKGSPASVQLYGQMCLPQSRMWLSSR